MNFVLYWIIWGNGCVLFLVFVGVFVEISVWIDCLVYGFKYGICCKNIFFGFVDLLRFWIKNEKKNINMYLFNGIYYMYDKMM